MPDQEYPHSQPWPPHDPNGSPSQTPQGHSYYPPGPSPFSSGNVPAIPPHEASDISLNLVLSIFFGWIPALVFFLRRDQVTPITRAVFVGNMNLQLTRLLVSVGGFILVISVMLMGAASIGCGGAIVILLSLLLWIAIACVSIAYFVISIVAAAQAKDRAMVGQPYQFPLAIRFFS